MCICIPEYRFLRARLFFIQNTGNTLKNAERQTRTRLMDLFREHGFHPNSRLGQNFLIDLNLIEFVVERAELDRSDLVLEVGAGTGGMTTFMAQTAGQVLAVEIDSHMIGLAQPLIDQYPNVTLLHTDVLKNKNHFSPDVLTAVQERLDYPPIEQLKLISNLPYSVATPVVSNLVATDLPWSKMVITIQLELAERMVAQPNTSDYGALSVWLQSQCKVQLLKRLPPTVFWPRPKVDSAFVELNPLPDDQKHVVDRRFFMDFVRRLFTQRRKYLRSVVVGMYRKQISREAIDELLVQMGFSENTRAETLPPEVHVELSNRLHAMMPA